MQTLRASKCGLSTAQLPSSILDVIDSLTKAGYEAYIVGGGVRDLMLGLNPKDFDAVTNATPSQIKEVFGRRCRIIGRRFELAHVYSGRELIEVATFRAPPKKAVTNASGMILRDNNWGTIEQDFARRDFSINTLYYQPRKGIVLDFCKAIDDVKNKTLRLLGDPVQRFEEDPVRMLRTLRFAAKLNFKIDPAILDIFDVEMTQLLRDVSPHRLYDESQKLFTMGHLARVLPMLIEFGVWKQLFADIRPDLTPFIQRAAKNTDQRIQIGKTINPAFFYAVLLWQPFLERCDFYLSKGVVPAEARAQAGLDVLNVKRHVQSFLVLPKLLFVKFGKCKPDCLIQSHSKLKHWQAMRVSVQALTSYYFVKSQEMTQHKEWEAGGMLTKKCQTMKKKLRLANIIVKKLKVVVRLLLNLLKTIELMQKLSLWWTFQSLEAVVVRKNVHDKSSLLIVLWKNLPHHKPI